MNTYKVTGVVETPFEMTVEADSDHDAENIAYHRLYDSSGGNLVYIDDVSIDDEL